MNESEAVAMFKNGASVNSVSKTLGIGYHLAKKIKDGMSESGETGEAKEKENPVFTLNLEVPEGRAADMLAAFPPEEIREAVLAMDEGNQILILQQLMQRRLDAVLSPEISQAFELPRLHAVND